MSVKIPEFESAVTILGGTLVDLIWPPWTKSVTIVMDVSPPVHNPGEAAVLPFVLKVASPPGSRNVATAGGGLGDREGEMEAEGEREDEGDWDGETDGDTLGDFEGDLEALGDNEGLADGDSDLAINYFQG